jgi:hypothetical protein
LVEKAKEEATLEAMDQGRWVDEEGGQKSGCEFTLKTKLNSNQAMIL